MADVARTKDGFDYGALDPAVATPLRQHTTDEVPVGRIKDGGAQMRVEMRPETVNDYAADMLGGATFPPVVLFFDGADYWLGDGFHRVDAARKIERETILAEVREGRARDAILYGVGSNASHGLRRTQADKRRAIERLLKDPEWAQWSDRGVADAVKVDHKTVAKVRRELTGEIPTPLITREQRQRLEATCADLDRICATDRIYFERRPERQHRVRRAAKVEIEQLNVLHGYTVPIPFGAALFVAVRNVEPGVRFRAHFFWPADSDVDVPEEIACAIFNAMSGFGGER